MGDVVSADVDVDILEVGAVIDDVEARPGESVDADVAVVISHVNCLNGATDGQDFPFIRDGIVGVIAGKDPNNLTLSFLTSGVVVGDDEMGAETSSIELKFKKDPARRVDVW